MVVNFLGFLLFAAIAGVLSLVGAFWGLSYFVRRQVSSYEKSQTETHNMFVMLLVNILVKVAQADGEVTREETKTIADFFRYNLRYNQSKLLWVKELVKDAIRSPVALEQLLTEFRRRFAYEPRLICLELVYQVIFSKQRIPPEELDLAARIAGYLGISPYDHMAIRGKYVAESGPARPASEKYYEVLGLAPDADLEAVKKAYRQLSMQYHPDKVAHLGEEFRKVAEEKMKELNEAYQYLKEKLAAKSH